MNKPITPSRLLAGLAMLAVFEFGLSVACFDYAKQAKAHLQQTFPASRVQLKGAAWVMARCGSFRLSGEREGKTHKFVDSGVPVATDLNGPDSQTFEANWLQCEHDSQGRGDWQDPIFDAVVLPLA